MTAQEIDGLTAYERSVGAVPVAAADLRVGDVLVLIGGCHRVDRLTPYTGPQIGDGTFPPGTQVAHYGGDRQITLTAPTYRILPRPRTRRGTR